MDGRLQKLRGLKVIDGPWRSNRLPAERRSNRMWYTHRLEAQQRASGAILENPHSLLVASLNRIPVGFIDSIWFARWIWFGTSLEEPLGPGKPPHCKTRTVPHFGPNATRSVAAPNLSLMSQGDVVVMSLKMCCSVVLQRQLPLLSGGNLLGLLRFLPYSPSHK